MKRILKLALMASVVGLIAAGCGKKADSDADKAKEDPKAEAMNMEMSMEKVARIHMNLAQAEEGGANAPHELDSAVVEPYAKEQGMSVSEFKSMFTKIMSDTNMTKQYKEAANKVMQEAMTEE